MADRRREIAEKLGIKFSPRRTLDWYEKKLVERELEENKGLAQAIIEPKAPEAKPAPEPPQPPELAAKPEARPEPAPEPVPVAIDDARVPCLVKLKDKANANAVMEYNTGRGTAKFRLFNGVVGFSDIAPLMVFKRWAKTTYPLFEDRKRLFEVTSA